MTGATTPARVRVAGPFFEDLERGYVERDAPALTLTEGHAALHQAILGGRLRLVLDRSLARRVLGADQPLAHPALVCDVAIGQSTLLTQRVIANLFYRGLVLRRAPLVGDTLRTTTEVVALRQNRSRAGRAPTGLAVLRIVTVDQQERPVLDFTRCAMLPLRDPEAVTGHADELHGEPLALEPAMLAAPVAGWDLAAMRAASPGSGFDELAVGTVWDVEGGDVVSAAPELARLSLNVAMAHHDRGAGQAGRRLVYGGHTIGLAATQLTRALPDLATIVAWHGCEHLAPVFEGDTLCSTIELERREPLPGGGGLLHLRSRVRSHRTDATAAEAVDVLDWRLVAVLA
jgi:acyl dehydratase